jgi:hypothetical protein
MAPQAVDMEAKAETPPQTTPRGENNRIIFIVTITVMGNIIISSSTK